MKTFFLVVLFSYPGSETPHVEVDHMTKGYPTLEACLQGKADKEYALIMSQIPTQVLFKAFCVEAEIKGFEEGKKSLWRRAGKAT